MIRNILINNVLLSLLLVVEVIIITLGKKG